MKSVFVTPKYEAIMSGVILSANDVVATVLLLDVDEGGYAPLTIAEVDLPFEARDYREKNVEAKSMFQRGDIIKIRCEVAKEDDLISDEDIEKILASLFDIENENAELYDQINEDAKKFVVYWNDLCERDLKNPEKKE